MSDLTPRQTRVLRFIQRSLSETGMPPTRAEIAAELGFRSPNAAEEHLRALARVSRLLRQSELRQQLRQARTADAVHALLVQDPVTRVSAA